MTEDTSAGAHVDNVNQQFSILGVRGTLGTADTGGTAKTLPVGVDPATGAAYVYNLGPAGSVSLGNTPGGTINRIGSIDVIGTMPSITTTVSPNLPVIAGTPINAATAIAVQLTDGTNFYTASSGGSYTNVASGTIGIVSNLTNGSIHVTAGTEVVTSGSIVVTAGTVGTVGGLGGTSLVRILDATGADLDLMKQGDNYATSDHALAVAALADGTPMTYSFLHANSDKDLWVDVHTMPNVTLAGGTINAGTVVANGGTIGVVSNITAGTIQNSGTVTGVGVVSAITSGTIQNSGTVTGVGVVSLLTGGTVSVNTPGTITSGSIAVTAGTIASVGTVPGIGVVTNITNGTIQNSGTVTGVGVVSVLTQGTVAVNTPGTITSGSIAVIAGTIASVGTVPGIGVVSNLTNGSIKVTAGTEIITAGTINSGTLNAGTINSGTVNAGTITNQPYPASQVLSAYAVGTAAAGTIVGSAGAGTGIYINSLILTAMSGTLDMCFSFALASTTAQVVTRGLFSAGQGVAIGYPYPSFYGTSNSPLTYQILGGAGTASWAVTYVTKGTP